MHARFFAASVVFDGRRELPSRRRRRRYGGKLFDQARRARRADPEIHFDQSLDDLAEQGRSLWCSLLQRLSVALQNPLHRFDVVRPIERAPPCHRLEQTHAERKQIRSSVDILAAHVLGRHVRDLAFRATACRSHRILDRLCDAEVRELRLSGAAQQNV